MAFLDQIEEVVSARGSELYGGEAVTQKQHALQCAALAEAEGAPPYLIVAALLHDIGHLLDNDFEAALTRGEDRRHEDIGHGYLSRWFDRRVIEPIRLHVDAKRYLCCVEPEYYARLSPSSVRTLELQGGPFSPSRARDFMAQRGARDAVKLRKWDDAAKDPGMQTPDLDHFLNYVKQVMIAPEVT